MFCPLSPLAAVASHNILPSRVIQMLGSGGSLTNGPWFAERCMSLICVCSYASEMRLSCSHSCWFLFFGLFFFAYLLLQFRYKILIYISALNSCPLPRWPHRLWSNQSNVQEIWDSLLLLQLREVSKHKNGLVTSKAARFFVAKEGKGYSSEPRKSSVS